MKLRAFREGYIYGLYDAKYSYSLIRKKCLEHGLNIAKSTISNVVNQCKNQPAQQRGRQEKSTWKRSQPTRPEGVVRGIRDEMLRENAPIQRSTANRKGIPQRTVGRIIHHNLGLERRHKARGYRLNERRIQERLVNSRKLYEQCLAGEKWQWVVTLDEAWIYLDDTNKPRAIFYKK